MRHHLAVAHTLTPKTGKIVKSQWMCSRVLHDCRVCKSHILCDMTVISAHIYNSHSLSHMEYRNRYPETREERIWMKKRREKIQPKPQSKVRPSNDRVLTVAEEQGNVTTKVGNLCEYQCDRCSFTVFSWQTLKNHLIRCHSLSIPKNFPEQKREKWLLKKVFHVCAVCNAKILCQLRAIAGHVSSFHKMKMDKYYLLLPKEVDSQKVPASTTAKELSRLPTSKSSAKGIDQDKNETIAATVSLSQPPTAPDDEGFNDGYMDFATAKAKQLQVDVTSKIADLWEFKCDSCDCVVTEWKTLLTHLRESHNKDGAEIDPRFCQKAVYHLCAICDQHIPCTVCSIDCHISEAHNISMDIYKTLLRDDEADSGPSGTVSGFDPTKDHQGKNAPNSDEKPPTAKDVLAIETNEPKPLPNDNLVPQESDKSEPKVVSDTTKSQCQFKCKFCQVQFDNFLSLREHLKGPDHNVNSLGKALIEECLVTSVLFQCRMCDIVLLCDHFFISMHAKMQHGLKVTEFRQRIRNLKPSKASGATSDANVAVENVVQSETKEPEPGNEIQELEFRYEGQSVSKVIDSLCVFSCKFCQKEMGNSTACRTHLKGQHDVERVTNSLLMECIKTKVLYRCSLCSKFLLCDRNIITTHAQSKHYVNMADYKKKIEKKRLQPPIPEPKIVKFEGGEDAVENEEPEMVQDFNECEKVEVTPEVIVDGSPNTAFNNQATVVTQSNITNACRFQCYICKRAILTYSSLLQHLRSKHRLKEGLYSKHILQTCITRKQYYHCQLCDRKMLRDRFIISRHCQKIHQMGLLKYEQHVEQERESTGTPSSGASDTVRESSSKYPLRSRQSKDIEVVEVVKKEGSSSQSSLVNQPLVEFSDHNERLDNVTEPFDLSNEKFSNEIDNLCSWKCKFCFRGYTSWGSLSGHMREAHGSSKHDKNEIKMKCLVKRVYFKCFLCEKIIPCDRTLISQHAWNAHKLSATTFKDQATANAKKNGFERFMPMLESQNISDDVDFGDVEMPIFFYGRTPITRRPANLCKYNCPECEAGTSNLSDLRKHLELCHQRTDEEEDHFRSMARLVLFACFLCDELLPCDKSLVFAHAMLKHSMNGNTFRYVLLYFFVPYQANGLA